MTIPQLSEGALRIIMSGGEYDNAIMQVLGSKKIASGSAGKERYRILLSDGKSMINFAMLTTQINDRSGTGEIPLNSIIQIKRYITSVINNAEKGDKRVLVLLDVETLVPGHTLSQIGCPENIQDTDLASNTNASTNGTSNVSSTSERPAAVVQARPNYARNNSADLNGIVSLQDQLTHPISSLSPYQNKWVIKARVSNKSSIRTWANSRGEGKLFSMDLVDESGEIRATIFKELVDKFYEMIEIDKVYYISKCQLKVANKQFTNLKNDYEMSFTHDTIVQECHDAVDSIPQIQYNFILINNVVNMEPGSLIDVIGVCKSASDVLTFQAKSTGRELKKRDVSLVDQSNTAVDLTLWGNDAETFDGSTKPVLAVKGAKVGEFGGGKNLSLVNGTVMKINPDLPDAHRLRGWFDNSGVNADTTNISTRTMGDRGTPWISFKDVVEQNLGSGQKGDYYLVKGTILLVRPENAIYKACPTEECNKKVVDMENGMFRCEKCNREYPNFKYRLLVSISVGDWSGQQWISVFNTEAEKVLGATSKEIGEAMEADPEAMANFADRANFKQFILKCRAKIESYNDESRLKTFAVKVDPVNYKEYNLQLVSNIQKLLN